MDTVSPSQTRSRSRSKTPFVPTTIERENPSFDNADRRHEKKRSPDRKEPTVQTIREEEEPSQTPAKRSKRDIKSSNISHEETTRTSNNVVVKMTSVTKEMTQEEATKSSILTSSSSKTSPKQDRVTQKEFNRGLEGSGIKISTPHNSKRVGVSSGNTNGDLSDHVAYKEYKDAGEYWNKYPKTDYTYSKLSPHRREIIPGVIAMPNMSRKSLEKHAERVNQMALKNPSQESFIRARYESNRYTKGAGRALHYDSGEDEIDLTQFEKRHYSQVQRQTIFRRLYTRIVTTIVISWYFIASRFKASEKKVYYESTELANEQRGIFKRVWSIISSSFLYIFQRVYLLIASMLLADTWVLQSKSDTGRHKKNFLWLLIFLLPLLLFGALYLSEEDQKTKMLSFLPLSHGWIPSVFMSSLTVSSWTDYLPANLFSMSSQGKAEREILNTHQHLNAKDFNRLVQHINQYIDTTINEKDKEQVLQENLNVLISKILKENIVKYKYELTEEDVDRLARIIQERVEFPQKAEPVVNQDLIDRITLSISEGLRKETRENNEEIILKMIQSNHLSQLIDKYLRDHPQSSDTSKYDDLVTKFSMEINGIRDDLLNRKKREEEIDIKLKALLSQQEMFNNRFNEFKMESDLRFQNLLNELETKVKSLNDEKYSEINKEIRRVLVQIFNLDQTDNLYSEDYLRTWITHIFVAKEYLETRLNDIQGKFEDQMAEEVQRSSGILMRNITETLRIEMQSLIEAKISGNQSHVKGIDINDHYVRKIVQDVLAVYDADKTGLVDYALESAGGQILSTRCTESYHTKTAQISIFGIPLWYPSNTPRTAISPSVQPGNCWAFQGFPGFLVLKLNLPILVTGFTMEHIPRALAPNGQIDSAPRDFSIWGLTDESDPEPIFFGKYIFEDNDRSLQYFAVENQAITRLHQIIELRIESNHGNPTYSCLYRFRVHGVSDL